MATTRKRLKTVAVVREGTPGSYTAPTTLLPYTTFDVHQEFEMIEDLSIVGVAFADLPVQGARLILGTIEPQGEVTAIAPLMKWAFGYNSSTLYTCPADKNEEAISIVAKDDVKTYKYAGCYCKSFTVSSAPKGPLIFKFDVIGWKAETRDDTAWPTISVNPGTRILHQHAGSTNGYARLADQADALAAGDNQEVKNISFGVNWNFDNDFVNDQGTLIPLSGHGGIPSADLSIQIARHTSDTWKAARDAATALQAAIRYYAGAAAAMLFEFPNLSIKTMPESGDEVPSQDITFNVARNGRGTTYSNANMSFVSPIRLTLTNS